jgi:hypothetical protein
MGAQMQHARFAEHRDIQTPMSDTPETQCETPHYYGCACHEKEWQNKWQSAVEMAAQAEAKLDALVEHHTRMIIAHAQEMDKALAVIKSIEERYIDGCDTYDDWKFMGQAARDYLLPPNNEPTNQNHD